MLQTGIVLALASGLTAAPGVVAPTGWSTATGAGGATIYTPRDLHPGEVFTVTVYPPQKIGGQSLSDWLLALAESDGGGDAPKVENNSNGLTVVSRPFRGADGSRQAHLYTAGSANGMVRAVRVTFSLATEVFPRYKDAANRIVRQTVSPGQIGVATAAKATATGKATLGGALTPGLYTGRQVTVSNGGKSEFLRGIRLYIYPNGEYRVNDGNDKPLKYNTGTFQYDAKTGKLAIDSSFNMVNDRYNPTEDFCYFGMGKNGTRVIFAENYRGYGTIKTTLGYAGATKTPSPTAEKTAKTATAAEAKRYKFVTPSGKGVQPGQIAAILHEYDVETYSAGASGMGTNVTDEAYLLLKDGTVHKGLPVAPDMLDVAASRRSEPKMWVRWRRNGNGYQIALAGGTDKKLDAKPVISASGARLSGRYGTGSSSANLMGSSYALWGVTFTKYGRFKKDGRGGSGNSLFMQNGGAPAINSTYDDNGSATSVLGADTTVLTTKKRNPNGDKEGTYSISGYAMTLRYDNGTVARFPFFYTLPDKSTVYFEGNQLAFDDGKD